MQPTNVAVFLMQADILQIGNQTNEYLSEYIEGFHRAPAEDAEHLKRVIQFHFADLSEQINSKDILPILTEKNIIEAVDNEKILAVYNSEGSTMATVHMLFLLHRCAGPGWFMTCVDAVNTTGNSTLADQLKQDGKKLDPLSSGSGSLLATSDQDNSNEMSNGDAFDSPDEDVDMRGRDEDKDEDTSNGSMESVPDAIAIDDTTENSAEKQEQEGAEKPQNGPSSPKAAPDCNDATNMLYEDQLEVALPGIAGSNILGIMPAGAGKTHVGASIIQEHIKNADDRNRCRVVFLVDKINLVEQQRSLLSRVLKPQEYFQIIGLHGGKMDVSLDEVFKTYNVVVLTAAILEEALRLGKVSLESLTLLVFDECHHCMKLHPYNAIMKKYKHEKHQQTNNSLPQIVGLTASPGTGKAKTQVGAENHLIQICANLDVETISKVKEFERVLHERVNIPEEIEPILISGRPEDPLKMLAFEIMGKMEKMIIDSPGASKLSTTTQLVPQEKSSQSYRGWLSSVQKESIQKITDGQQQQLVSTCLEYLEYFHDALRINEEVRTKDAVDFLNGKLDDQKKQMERFSEVDWDLFKLFMSKKVNFDEISTNPAYKNPLLTKLKEVILSEYKKRPESRALLFCQTREGTKALKAWIEQTPELQFLCPGRIVGARDMTDSEQNEVLNKFREGEHEMVVATNVAEEGLDVPECNLVFRINYVPSDTGYVQVKGRDRAKDGKSYLIALADSNYEMRELANKAREDMQNKAVEALCSMSPEEFKTRISKQQKWDVMQEITAEQNAAHAASALPQGGYTLLCAKCLRLACSSLDIVKYKTNHIVLDNVFNTDRARFENNGRQETFGDVSNIGRVYCGGRDCTQPWGSLGIILEKKFPIIKISQFLVRKNDAKESDWNYQLPCTQWKNAPFSLKVLTEEQLGALERLNIPDFAWLAV